MFRFPGKTTGGGSSGDRTQGKSTSLGEAGTKGGSDKKVTKSSDLKCKKQVTTRACMICSLIKTELEFEEDGCDNCETILNLVGQKRSVFEYTSLNYEGMIAMISPKDSWVAKWQKLVHLKPGVYAVNVKGKLPKSIRKQLKHSGQKLINRDKSMPSKTNNKPEESSRASDED